MDVSVSSGRFKGKKLRIPDSMSDFRPTKLVIREAVCSSIMMDIMDASVLELCGGSGVFSFELISRGANSATIVELDKKRADIISQFASELGIDNDVAVFGDSVLNVIPKLDQTFDIIFFDPPYYADDLAAAIPDTLNLLSPAGVMIFEHASDDSFIDGVDVPEEYKVKIKKYGNSTVRYYRSKEY